MNTRTKLVIRLAAVAAAVLPQSPLLAQRTTDEIMAAYRNGTAGTTDLTFDVLCQRDGPRTPAVMDDLATRLVGLALADPEAHADRIASHLSAAGSPPASVNCTPYEGAWDALATIYEGADISIRHLLKLDVQRGVEHGLAFLGAWDLKEVTGRRRLCETLVHAEQGGELALLADGTLEFTARSGYDPRNVRITRPGWSERTRVLAEELMLEGFIPRTGWPWSPCMGNYSTGGFVSGFADDGTPLPPDTGWASIQSRRGFHLSPAGDTLRVLKRK